MNFVCISWETALMDYLYGDYLEVLGTIWISSIFDDELGDSALSDWLSLGLCVNECTLCYSLINSCWSCG